MWKRRGESVCVRGRKVGKDEVTKIGNKRKRKDKRKRKKLAVSTTIL